jgi:hypothetical protein
MNPKRSRIGKMRLLFYWKKGGIIDNAWSRCLAQFIETISQIPKINNEYLHFNKKGYTFVK